MASEYRTSKRFATTGQRDGKIRHRRPMGQKRICTPRAIDEKRERQIRHAPMSPYQRAGVRVAAADQRYRPVSHRKAAARRIAWTRQHKRMVRKNAEHRAQQVLDVNLFGQAAHVGTAHLGHHFTPCIRHAERLVASPGQNDRASVCHSSS